MNNEEEEKKKRVSDHLQLREGLLVVHRRLLRSWHRIGDHRKIVGCLYSSNEARHSPSIDERDINSAETFPSTPSGISGDKYKYGS